MSAILNEYRSPSAKTFAEGKILCAPFAKAAAAVTTLFSPPEATSTDEDSLALLSTAPANSGDGGGEDGWEEELAVDAMFADPASCASVSA